MILKESVTALLPVLIEVVALHLVLTESGMLSSMTVHGQRTPLDFSEYFSIKNYEVFHGDDQAG